MKIIPEVLHLVRKDILHLRWFFMVYLALVMLSILSSTRVAFPTYLCVDGCPTGGVIETAQWMLPLLNVLVAVMITATLFQEDSPTTFGAFWTARPVRGGAVVVGKLLLVCIAFAGVGSAALAVALFVNGFSASAVIQPILHSAGQFISALLITALIASATRNLRDFVIGIVGLVIAVGITSTIPPVIGWMRDLTVTESIWFAVLSCAGACATLAWLYVLRRSNWKSKLVAFLAAFIAFRSLLTPSEFGMRSQFATRAVLELHRTSQVTAALSDGQIVVEVRTSAPGSKHQLVFVNPIAELNLPDGRSIRLNGGFSTNQSSDGNRTEVAFHRVTPSATKPGSDSNQADGGWTLPFFIPASVLQEANSRTASLSFRGFIEAQIDSTLLDIPLSANFDQSKTDAQFAVRYSRQGKVNRLEISSLSLTTADSPLSLNDASVVSNVFGTNYIRSFGQSRTQTPIDFYIINDSPTDTLQMRYIGQSEGSSMFVLPFQDLFRTTNVLTSQQGNAYDTSLDDFKIRVRQGHLVIRGYRYESYSPVVAKLSLH